MKKIDFPTSVRCPGCTKWVRIRPRQDRDIFKSKCIGFIEDHRAPSVTAKARSSDEAGDEKPWVDVIVQRQCEYAGAAVGWDGAV